MNNNSHFPNMGFTPKDCCDVPPYASHTHSVLLLMMTSGVLVPNSMYLISDYITSYTQPITLHDRQAFQGERIVLFATSIGSFSEKAFSLDFPDDEIIYDIKRQATANGLYCTGSIVYRKTSNGNSAYYDHRTIVFKRWETVDSPYLGINDNGNPSNDYLTFEGSSNCTIDGNRDNMPMLPNHVLADSVGMSVGIESKNCTAVYCAYGTIGVQAFNGKMMFAANSTISDGTNNCSIVNVLGGLNFSNNVNIGSGGVDVSVTGRAIDVNIGSHCESLVLSGKYITIGNNGKNITLIDLNDSLMHINIGDDCEDIAALATKNMTVGNGVKTVGAQNVLDAVIGDYSDMIQMTGVSDVRIGSNSHDVRLGDTINGDVVEDITIGECCNDILVQSGSITIAHGCYDIDVFEGSNNSSIGCFTFDVSLLSAKYCSIGNNNMNVSIADSDRCVVGNSNMEVIITQSSNNVIGSLNNIVQLENSENNNIGSSGYDIKLTKAYQSTVHNRCYGVQIKSLLGLDVFYNVVYENCALINIKGSNNFVYPLCYSVTIEENCNGNTVHLMSSFVGLTGICEDNEVGNKNENISLVNAHKVKTGLVCREITVSDSTAIRLEDTNESITVTNGVSCTIGSNNLDCTITDATASTIGSNNMRCNIQDNNNEIGDSCSFVDIIKDNGVGESSGNSVTHGSYVTVHGYRNIVHFSNNVTIGDAAPLADIAHDNKVYHSNNIVILNNCYDNEMYNCEQISLEKFWSRNVFNETTEFTALHNIGYLNTFNKCINVQTSDERLVRVTLDNVQNSVLPVVNGGVSGLNLYGNVFHTRAFRGHHATLGFANYQEILFNLSMEYTEL